MKMESLQQRREELERKEFQLKESLLKFDKFLKVINYFFHSENAFSHPLSFQKIYINIYRNNISIFVGILGKWLQEGKSTKKGSRRTGNEKS